MKLKDKLIKNSVDIGDREYQKYLKNRKIKNAETAIKAYNCAIRAHLIK